MKGQKYILRNMWFWHFTIKAGAEEYVHLAVCGPRQFSFNILLSSHESKIWETFSWCGDRPKDRLIQTMVCCNGARLRPVCFYPPPAPVPDCYKPQFLFLGNCDLYQLQLVNKLSFQTRIVVYSGLWTNGLTLWATYSSEYSNLLL